MNNSIVQEKVQFSVAYALKKGGFDCTSSDYWLETLDGDIIHSDEKRDCPEHDRPKLYYWQPTLDFAIEWLRVNYSTHIWVSYDGTGYTYNIRHSNSYGRCSNGCRWCNGGWSNRWCNREMTIVSSSSFTSLDEAKKAALGYVSYLLLL